MFGWWDVGLLVLGAALGVIADRLARWWRDTQADHELWVWLEPDPIASIGPKDALTSIQLTHDGVALSAPSVVTLFVWSAGSRDIWTDAFDGKPLEAALGCKIVEVIRDDRHGAEQLPVDLASDATLRIGPGSLRRDFAVGFRLLVDGDPGLEVRNQPLDTEVLYYQDEFAKRSRKWWARPGITVGLLVSTPVLLGTGMAFSLRTPQFAQFNDLSPWLLGGAGLIFGLFLLDVIFLIDAAPRRARRAGKILRRALGVHVTRRPRPPLDTN
ncbi:hypothetical protein GCM10027515_10190 [Schumannella luteola]|uniref:Uncharacterized protein n=1 Tax=Schumannella luteola TaxID=472059 RepID=A0A852YEC5_9MICO|nr:hypothetical protein [Schumannella luteola]NYG97468.1 hypothetical protein [Schumannella luteola]TPX05885.1 hypothetical protein FJ656_04105 [Schumannella luteola]